MDLAWGNLPSTSCSYVKLLFSQVYPTWTSLFNIVMFLACSVKITTQVNVECLGQKSFPWHVEVSSLRWTNRSRFRICCFKSTNSNIFRGMHSPSFFGDIIHCILLYIEECCKYIALNERVSCKILGHNNKVNSFRCFQSFRLSHFCRFYKFRQIVIRLLPRRYMAPLLRVNGDESTDVLWSVIPLQATNESRPALNVCTSTHCCLHVNISTVN